MEKAFTVVLAILLWTVVSWPANGAMAVECNNSVSLDFLEDVVRQQMTLTQTLQASLEAERNRASAAEQGLENKLTAARNEYDAKLTAAKSDYNSKVASAEAKINSLQANLTLAKAHIGELQSQVNRSLTSVAFTVRFRNDDASNGLTFGQRAILAFDFVVSNAGDGYDPQTGIFTAPLAGTYAFYLNVMGMSEGGLHFEKNGASLGLVYTMANNDQGSGQVTTHLAEDDKVWIRHTSVKAIRGGGHTVFTGFLLQAD